MLDKDGSESFTLYVKEKHSDDWQNLAWIVLYFRYMTVFWAPSGAQGVPISVRMSVMVISCLRVNNGILHNAPITFENIHYIKLSRALKLCLSGSNIQIFA